MSVSPEQRIIYADVTRRPATIYEMYPQDKVKLFRNGTLLGILSARNYEQWNFCTACGAAWYGIYPEHRCIAYCASCGEAVQEHVEGQCLFSPTTFTQKVLVDMYGDFYFHGPT